MNTYGSRIEVVNYYGHKKVWVLFTEFDYLKKTTWQQFCEGRVKSPYDRSVYKNGYLGEGKYKPKENGEETLQYRAWKSMMRRCYSKIVHDEHPTYNNCEVSLEWKNFQNFAKWYDENYYEVDGEKMNLDKDILVKGNKLYSAETCVYAPVRINNLFIKKSKVRDLPLGVIHAHKGKFEANCINKDGKIIHLRRHNTPEEAFLVYKTFKEKIIKEVAEEYKNKIPRRLYEALINYTIDITDR